MKPTLKILALVVSIFVAFLAYRYYVYESEDNLRAGLTAFKSANYEEAFNLIEPYSKHNKVAQETVAKLYAYGLYPKRDFARAEELFKNAAESDDEFAEYAYYVGLNYLEGSPLTSQDSISAQYWLELASRSGNTSATNRLQRK